MHVRINFYLPQLVILAMHPVKPAPQNLGQAISLSSIVGPNGEVNNNSIYTDTNGNIIVNGVKKPITSTLGAQTIQILSRPGWEASGF